MPQIRVRCVNCDHARAALPGKAAREVVWRCERRQRSGLQALGGPLVGASEVGTDGYNALTRPRFCLLWLSAVDDDGWLTQAQAAVILGVTRGVVSRLVRDGLLWAQRFDGMSKVRFDGLEVAILAEQRGGRPNCTGRPRKQG